MLRRFSLPLLAVLVVLLAVPSAADAGERSWRYWYAQNGTPNHHVVDSNSGYCDFTGSLVPNWTVYTTRTAASIGGFCNGGNGAFGSGTWKTRVYRNGAAIISSGCAFENSGTRAWYRCNWPATGGSYFSIHGWRFDLAGNYHWQAGAGYFDSAIGDHNTYVGPAGEVIEFDLYVYP